MPLSLQDIQDAQDRIKDSLVKTPATYSRTLSDITGAKVHLKHEIFQYTAAFKERGALNKLLKLTDAERAAGVIAMSAGNHAQGVAYHATRLKIPATIVMPEGSPFSKVMNTERLGAKVVLAGNNFAEASAAATRLMAEQSLTLLHPFDDEDIIAGQGTIALEFLQAFPNLETLVVPIGGGGLISGMAIAAKALNPEIKIIGVQTELYPGMKSSVDGTAFDGGGISIAEGIAVKEPGQITRRIVKDLVDDILVVSERHIEDAINLMLEIEKVVVEGAAAASLAALLQFADRFKDQNVGLVLTGGNIDSRLLSQALMKGLARDGRVAYLRVLLPDMPGALAKVSNVIAKHGANVLEVEHRREFSDVSLKQAVLNIVIESQNSKMTDAIMDELRSDGFDVELAATAA